jgi:hypothetical protein
MNRIIFIILCISAVSCTSKIKVKTDYERLKLAGNVKLITEIYFLPVISGDTIKRGERASNETSFFESTGDEPFSAYETKVYFNNNGNITECLMTETAADFHFKETFDYQDNLLITKLGLLSGEFFYKEIYHYDSKNREIERNFYDSEKHLFESVILEYPNKNTIIERIHTGNEYSDFERETQLKNGLPVVSISRIDSARIIEQWSGEYDDNNRVILSKFYDSQGNMVQYEKYIYDEFGNELVYSMYSADNELLGKYEYRYKYDEYGNWTQQVSIIDGYPTIIMVRDISYY